jgi:hypothetical protein
VSCIARSWAQAGAGSMAHSICCCSFQQANGQSASCRACHGRHSAGCCLTVGSGWRGNGVLSGRVLLDKTSDWCVSCCVIVAEQLHQWVPRMCVRVLPAGTQQVVISSCQQCRCEVGCCDDASQLCSRSFMQTALCCGATMWDRTGVLR